MFIIADRCITFNLSDNIIWALHHLTSTMTTSLKVCLPSLLFNSIVVYYFNWFETIGFVYSVVKQNLLRDISEYVLPEKDNLALDFARNSPMNNTLVKIDNEFLLEWQMHFILEPQLYLKDVVSIVLFILNNNTHATGVHICKTIFMDKHRFSICT
jgi:hypothetical protein